MGRLHFVAVVAVADMFHVFSLFVSGWSLSIIFVCLFLSETKMKVVCFSPLDSSQDHFNISREKHFKVLLIGDANVGKTSFVQRYANDSFRQDYKGTVGVDFALKILRVSGDTLVKLQLWDVAGN